MGIARKVVIGVGALLGVVVVGGGGFYLWASSASASKLAATYDIHRVDFPIPFPLTDDELATLRAERMVAPGTKSRSADPLAGVDLSALAMERAVARGKHLVDARYACGECHGANFGGGTMVNDAAIGLLLGPNLTTGKGSRTLTYAATDWDRIVRHGIKPDGTPTPMPSTDFFAMSDEELSDIVAYIRSQPPVDSTVPAVSLGPLGKVLAATGKLQLSATIHPANHILTHVVRPPTAVADATFGKHLAQTCTGCHRANLAGGPIVGGPPDWPPAANLTPTGLVDWSFEDFQTALIEGKSKNGRALLEPMASMPKFAKNMTDVERHALWEYIKAVPATPTGK